MSWTRNALLALGALIVGFAIVELLTRVFIGHPLYLSNAASRVILYEKGNNFQNVDRIFKYQPNTEFHTETLFVSHNDDSVTREYGYNIRTNNIGLIQTSDIPPESEVYVLLGDSFTEGQGATPWFYKLEEENKDKKIVNGGILGTGPAQWKQLYDHLVRDYRLKVKKLIIIAIGPDIIRPVWNFSEEGLECLRNARCGTFQGDWFGYEFNGKSDAAIKADAKSIHRKWTEVSFGLNRQSFKNLLKKSAFLYTIVHMSKGVGSTDENLEAIRVLGKAAPDVRLLMIPTKNEARTAGAAEWEENSAKLMAWSKQNGIRVSECLLEKSDYHLHDGHPNESGYAKLIRCVYGLL